MKNLIALILCFTATVALAGKTGDDSWQIGNPTSSFDKKLIFDTGDGSSNKYWLLDHTTKKLSSNVDQITFGSGLTANQSLIFNRGSNNPSIRWNEANSVLEFSNDGTSYVNIGSGSGGSAGLNLISTNPDFEQSLALGWTATGLSFTAATSGSNLLFGKQSAVVDSSTTGQTLDSDLYTVPIGLRAAACEAKIFYLGGDNTYTLQVIDGSSAVVASQPFPTSHTTVSPFSLTFQCPSSGSIKLRIASTANGAAMAIDRMFLGELALSQISQASLLGALYSDSSTSSNCQVDYGTSVSTWQDPVTQGCTIAYQGQAVALTPPLLGFTAPVGPGVYRVHFDFRLNYSGAGGNPTCRVVDDLGNQAVSFYQQSSSPLNMMDSQSVDQSFIYTSARQATFKIQCEDLAVTSNHLELYRASDSAFHMDVFQYPAASQLAYQPGTSDWHVNASFGVSGGMAAYSGTFGPGYPSAGTALTTNPGSIPVSVPCSGTNPPDPSGNCSAGTSEPGVSFIVPIPGEIRACVSWVNQLEMSNSSGEEVANIDWTADADDTVVIKAGDVQQAQQNYVPAQFVSNVQFPTLCQNFVVSSAGRVTLRWKLQYTAVTGGGASTGFWTVNPVTQNFPVPVLINSVISPSVGIEKVVRLGFGGAGSMTSETSCSADPCTIYTQSGASVTAVNRLGTGDYAIHFAAGTFSEAPICECQSPVGGNAACNQNGSGTSTLVTIQGFQATTGNANIDIPLNILCMGPK